MRTLCYVIAAMSMMAVAAGMGKEHSPVETAAHMQSAAVQIE